MGFLTSYIRAMSIRLLVIGFAIWYMHLVDGTCKTGIPNLNKHNSFQSLAIKLPVIEPQLILMYSKIFKFISIGVLIHLSVLEKQGLQRAMPRRWLVCILHRWASKASQLN